MEDKKHKKTGTYAYKQPHLKTCTWCCRYIATGDFCVGNKGSYSCKKCHAKRTSKNEQG